MFRAYNYTLPEHLNLDLATKSLNWYHAVHAGLVSHNASYSSLLFIFIPQQ